MKLYFINNQNKNQNMKKILSVILLVGLFSAAQAQRFGTTPSHDNTGRKLTYAYSAPAFASTKYLTPNASWTYYNMGKLTGAQTDSLSTANAQLGDVVIYSFLCDTLTAGRVVTFSGHNAVSGTLTIAKNKRGAITFIYDGAYWVATGREKQ
jgi:hypothetical protein